MERTLKFFGLFFVFAIAITIFSFSIFTFSSTQVYAEGSFVFTSHLELGVVGNDVKELQTLLNSKGYNVGIPDGKFGTTTKEQVILFQKANGLTPDGIVGQGVRAFLNGTSTITPTTKTTTTPKVTTITSTTPVSLDRTLKLSMTGNDVKALQIFLNNSGYNCGIADGSFGPKTEAQVKLFQTANNLTPDGLVGPMTKAIMGGNLFIGSTSQTTVGCTSGALFNTNTGQSCAVAPITSLGCTPGALFNTVTGQTCVKITLPLGCTSTSLFSTTSGVSCTTGLPATPIILPRVSGGGSSGSSIHTVSHTITGVTIPAQGGTPVATLSDTTQYSATIAWTGDPTVFAVSTEYTAIITLTAKSGFTLTGIPANYFTVAGATSTNSVDSGIITAIFPATPIKQLTISPSSLTTSKVYDNNTTAAVTVGTLSGKVGTDVVTVTGVATYDDMNIGTGKTIITVYTLAGADASKYIKPVDETVNTGEITAKPITVTADSSQTKVYGATDPTFTYTNTALLGSDVFTGSLSRAAGETVATYAITEGSLLATNYAITFVPANFSITQKALTVTAVTGFKTYDGNTTSSDVPTVGTLITGDVVNIAPTQTYDNSNVGITHTMTASGLTIKDGSNANMTANYNISYVTNETGIINPVLTYTAGAYGSIVGTSPQAINYGTSGTTVTATPSANYHFVSWSDAYPTAARTDTNVTDNISATASFAIDTYALSIPTSTGTGTGSYGGTSAGATNYNTAVSITATPDASSTFTSWTATGAAASCNGTSVSPCAFSMTGVASVTAVYTLKTFTLTYSAGAGTLTGSSPQTVNYGASGSEVTANPPANYHFTTWSDTLATAARTNTNVTSNISVTASFAVDTYTLTYTAGDNGSIVGTTPQTINHGSNGTEVTATPSANYHFVSWSDAVGTAARTDTNVTDNITVTASFAIDTYTVTFDGNGYTGGSTVAQSLAYNTGTALTMNGFTKTGYTFASWNTLANGAGTSYANGATYTIGAAPVTLYAQWNIVLTIGMAYQGGKIAYLDGTGHGIIAATSDQSTGIIWATSAYQSTSVTGTGTAIGTGSANTDKIIAQHVAIDTSTYAAGLARASRDGYSDWYLPSSDELNKLYLNKEAIGGFTSNFYWSSSEYSATFVWNQDFHYGIPLDRNYYKDNPNYVRAVRAF